MPRKEKQPDMPGKGNGTSRTKDQLLAPLTEPGAPWERTELEEII